MDRIIGSTPCVEYRLVGASKVKRQSFASESRRDTWINKHRTIDELHGKHWVRIQEAMVDYLVAFNLPIYAS